MYLTQEKRFDNLFLNKTNVNFLLLLRYFFFLLTANFFIKNNLFNKKILYQVTVEAINSALLRVFNKEYFTIKRLRNNDKVNEIKRGIKRPLTPWNTFDLNSKVFQVLKSKCFVRKCVLTPCNKNSP